MSIQNIFSANGYNLECNNLTVAGTLSVDGETSDHQQITLAYSGPWAASQNGTVYLTKTGHAVNITVDQVTAAATSANIITSAQIPAAFFPPVVISQRINVEDNSAGALGTVTLSNTGILNIAVNFNSNFQNSGVAGFFGFAMSFSQ